VDLLNTRKVDQLLALKERLVNAKCKAELARRRADDAVINCKLQEEAYAGACHLVRDLEKELQILTGKPWWRL